jgi:hypothetical protein
MDRKSEAENIPEITPDMIEAGLAAIDPFDLQDAADGYLGRDELVSAIFRAMYLARQRDV